MSNTNFTSIGRLSITGLVTVTDGYIVAALRELLVQGSQKGAISMTELILEVDDLTNMPTPVTVEWLVRHGVRFFHAVMYCGTEDKGIRVPEIGNNVTPIADRSMSVLAQDIFYLGFFLMTQARPPMVQGEEDNLMIPRFLSTVMGFTRQPPTVVNNLGGELLGRMNHTWIRLIDWRELSGISNNRFGLGVAGYRMLSVFKAYVPRSDISPALRNAADFANYLATSPPNWEIHPITRSAALLNATGALNENLGNLILECFTEEDVAEMVNSKYLFARPAYKAKSTNYRTWSMTTYRLGNELIFPPPQNPV